ncbi:MAG: ABC transporter permease subunit [Alphaproteobacteria bacterium]|nr:ABC transporter permease subunit [Alphaproteobacteria bacterium]
MPDPGPATRPARSRLRRRLLRSPPALAAALVLALLLLGAAAAPWLAPADPYDPMSVDIFDARTPPLEAGPSGRFYWLGTDNQGRDLLSAILYGLRTSLLVGGAAVGLAMAVGVPLGLLAGWSGGLVQAAIMRAADVQLSFPTILVALLFDGLAQALLPGAGRGLTAYGVVIGAIALASWAHFARPVRGLVLVEAQKAYVDAALIAGRGRAAILALHILPNIAAPILVIATLSLVLAILTEATLSFLGVGLPIDEPSLGTLVQNGQHVLAAGEWWIAGVPGLALVLLALSVNLLGDWLRDASDPRFARPGGWWR